MNFKLCISRRSLAIAAALAGTVSLAIGAHAALNLRALDAAKAVATEQDLEAAKRPSRIALVIGNSNYQNAPQLANPDNDAQSMAQFLNSAGFEVISATDLGQNDMLRVVQDFSAKVSARGPNTVAMVYYAGHGVQLAGENLWAAAAAHFDRHPAPVRRATSAASGERDGDSVAMARSDMGLSRLAGKPDRIKQDRHSPYMDCARELQFAGVFAYRTSDADQYVSAAIAAAAGMVITQA